ncbi:MAG: MFS transporter [Gammaproteobacteria bacterium]|nr:MAG: MFS transporter [Gammaproteobacteria bacterium]
MRSSLAEAQVAPHTTSPSRIAATRHLVRRTACYALPPAVRNRYALSATPVDRPAVGLARLLGVKRHEWPALIVAFIYFFCVLAAYFVIRPVRDQFPAAIGSKELPFFYGVVFIAMLVLTPLYGKLVARYPRGLFVPAVYALAALVTLGFIPLFQLQDVLGVRMLGVLFFVWGSVFNLFVVAVFWSFMADLFDSEQAHRLFPVIALGGALGAILGPALTNRLVHQIGVSGLLVFTATLLASSIVCVLWLSRWSRAHPVAGDEDREQRIIGGSMLAGAQRTLSSPFLRRVALLMLLGDAVGTIIYAMLADYNGATHSTRESQIEFLSAIDFATNLLQMILQIALTRELMVRLGPRYPLALDGVIKAATMLAMIAFGAPFIAAVAVVTRASAYGVFKPAADSLYTRVDAEIRYKGKSFIDTTVWRFGDIVITLAFNALKSLGTALPGFALIAAAGGLASGWIGWRLATTPELAPDQSRSSGA